MVVLLFKKYFNFKNISKYIPKTPPKIPSKTSIVKIFYISCYSHETILFSSSDVEEYKKNNWFLDSDCNNHMCGDKNMFDDLDESFRSFVKFGNNKKLHVLGFYSMNKLVLPKSIVIASLLLSCQRIQYFKREASTLILGFTSFMN